MLFKKLKKLLRVKLRRKQGDENKPEINFISDFRIKIENILCINNNLGLIMSISITAEQFFKTWCKVAAICENDLVKEWHNRKTFTSLILHNDNALLKEIGDELDFKCYAYGRQGYYWIDGVLYKSEDLFPDCPKEQTWLRKIRVALEHENDFNSNLLTEVGRLLLVNCELRVIVTYPNKDKDWDKLKNIHNFIKTTDGSDFLSENDSFLIVFGWKNEIEKVEWEGRVFNSEDWVQLSLK